MGGRYMGKANAVRLTAPVRVRFASLGARRFGRILIDVLLSSLSFLIAEFLGEGGAAVLGKGALPADLVLFCCVCAVVYLNTGLHTVSWRFASVADFFVMARDVLIAATTFTALSVLLVGRDAYSAPIIAVFIMITLMGGMRVLYRSLCEGGVRLWARKDALDDAGRGRPVNLLVYGATSETDGFLRSLKSTSAQAFKVVGIVDDDPSSRDRRVRGVKVLGAVANLPEILERMPSGMERPKQLVLPASGLPRQKLREIVDMTAASGLRAVRLPTACDLLQKANEAFAFEPVKVTDLLGREPVALQLETIGQLIHGKAVVVTGGGGSIGSELCRRLLKRNPAKLIIIDHSEYNLFQIERELAASDHAGVVQPILASVRDREKIEKIFREASVDLVFHAAAYKHVPLVESNPTEGLLTNMVGASYVADAAAAVGAAAMIMVSTDKAVKPSNTMGMSKRLAEAYCQSMDMHCSQAGRRTRFMVVRFGNVLGSSGSVVPIFEQQIKRGGPVTVTDKEMTRYFMTIPEAVELVLQGAAFGVDYKEWAGAILVLDMGDPVPIVDLARRMISLAGLVPDKDVKIEFTGIRSGEKLHEELFDDNETLETTDVPGIRLARSHVQELARMRELRDSLVALGPAGDAETMNAIIRSVIDGDFNVPAPFVQKPRRERAASLSPLLPAPGFAARSVGRHHAMGNPGGRRSR